MSSPSLNSACIIWSMIPVSQGSASISLLVKRGVTSGVVLGFPYFRLRYGVLDRSFGTACSSAARRSHDPGCSASRYSR
eukprot:4705335-Prymnesium_polylepis.1